MTDTRAYSTQDLTPEQALVHFGVKGMHWGVRKNRTPGVPSSVDREARKDAQEFARAKAFFGEGAGTRRKLIKQTVEAKSRRDPKYKKAFDNHLAQQNQDVHVRKAKGERKRKDVVNSTAKTARGIRHILNGNAQYASLAAAMLVGGAMYARKTGIDKIVFNAAKTTLQNARHGAPGAGQSASDFLRSMGIS